MKAPDFSLTDQIGKVHKLADYHGQWLLIYFYPKDDTPGCTKEACSFRDLSQQFKDKGINIIGISKDNLASHKKFVTKYNLNFPILSDPTHQVIEAYGAWGTKKFMGKEYQGTLRNSYLIDPEGQISKSYLGVDPLTHPEEVLKS